MPADRALAPSDAAVAMRSFPRRFRTTLATPGDPERDDPDEVARRVGDAGLTAAEHLITADAVLAALTDALTRGDASAELPAVVADDGRSIPSLLDRFDSTAMRAAKAIDDVPTGAWDELLRLTQDAVGAVSDHLRATQRVLSEVV